MKKAQQEIVGFVLIVVIVSIIGLIFLSLSLGKGERVGQTSIEISNLLESSMYYTTDCAVSFIPKYKSGQDLIKACYRNEKCLNENCSKENCKDENKKLFLLKQFFKELLKNITVNDV